MAWIEASAPSNIAIIKYMGKIDAALNRPANVSVSYTLENLRSFARMQLDDSLSADLWLPYLRDDLRALNLSETGREKFLNFFQELKKEFKLRGFYRIESANNFPSDCGLASSASSFAALTLCAHAVYLHSHPGTMAYRPKELSRISQKGSGSSCRSFFSPWGLWHENGAEEIQLPYKNLHHMVILCDEGIKKVSSSQAHKLVLSSDLFKGRPERANDRYHRLVTALRGSNWVDATQIAWSEFWDMHVLFHTSRPAFMYMTASSQSVLEKLLQLQAQDPVGAPIVTMDAGSNIHLLFEENRSAEYGRYQSIFNLEFNLWTSDGYRNKNEST